MDSKKDGSVTDQLEGRFEEIFDERKKASSTDINGKGFKNCPIIGLKTTLLSIDWEISDEELNALMEEIDKLEDMFKGDKDILLFLNLLRSAGRYIKKRKVNAHPGAVKLLSSVYNALEEVLLSKKISPEEKRQKLLIQVEAFKKLKEQISRKQTGVPMEAKAKPPADRKSAPAAKAKKETGRVEERPPGTTRKASPKDISAMTPQEALAYMLSEIRAVIRAEFKALKQELKK